MKQKVHSRLTGYCIDDFEEQDSQDEEQEEKRFNSLSSHSANVQMNNLLPLLYIGSGSKFHVRKRILDAIGHNFEKNKLGNERIKIPRSKRNFGRNWTQL